MTNTSPGNSLRVFRGLAVVCGLLAASTAVYVQESPHLPKTDKTTPQTQADSGRRPNLIPLDIPFPGSLVKTEVVANIKAIAQQTGLVAVSKISELNMIERDLIARRILQVRDEEPVRTYLVVELEDSAHRPIANVAITRQGALMMVEDMRNIQPRRPPDLSDALQQTSRDTGRVAESAEYVHFASPAEPGISLTRPLTAVKVAGGTIFLNSRGEAFVEDATPLARELNADSGMPRLPAGRRLRALPHWQAR